MSDTTTQASAEPIGVFTWGTKGSADYIETPVTDISSRNLSLLALQGYRHKLGNEVAARITAWKKSDEGKDASDEAVADKAREFRNEMLDKILNGVLGVRAAAGPRVTGDEAIKNAVTLETLKVFLKKHNLKLPTGEDTIQVAGKDMNRAQLLEAMYRRDKEKIDREVEHRKSVAASGAEQDLEGFGD